MSLTQTRKAVKTNALRKTIKWMLGNMFFGLLPLEIVLFFKSSAANGDPIGENSRADLIGQLKGGVLVFFFCALMGAITVDIIIEGKKFPFWRHTFLVKIPFCIVVLLSGIYVAKLYGTINEDYLVGSGFIPFMIMLYALFYCIIIKATNFAKEVNKL